MVDHIAQEIPKYLQSRQASDFARFHADKISIVSLQAWFQKYRFMPTRKKYLGMAMPEGVQLTKWMKMSGRCPYVLRCQTNLHGRINMLHNKTKGERHAGGHNDKMWPARRESCESISAVPLYTATVELATTTRLTYRSTISWIILLWIGDIEIANYFMRKLRENAISSRIPYASSNETQTQRVRTKRTTHTNHDK